MPSVLCKRSFDLHRMQSKRLAKSFLVRQRTWTQGTGSAWGYPSIADPRSPQLLKDPVGKLSELIPLHTCVVLQKKNALSPFKVEAWRHLEKSEIWHTQPGNGSHLGVLIFWGQGPGWPAEWSWGAAGRRDRGKGQMGHVKLLRTAPNTSEAWAFELRGWEATQAAFALFAIKQRRKVPGGAQLTHIIFSLLSLSFQISAWPFFTTTPLNATTISRHTLPQRNLFGFSGWRLRSTVGLQHLYPIALNPEPIWAPFGRNHFWL